MRFTRHGFREMLIGSVALAVVAVGLGFAWWPLAIVCLPVLVWLFAFFRDPERNIPAGIETMVSPADGTVSDVGELPSAPLMPEPCVRVGIFLSVFNVHVNRSPCDGEVAEVVYKHGKFINAMSHATASDDNESNTALLVDRSTKRPVAVVKQIVGLIARRIVFSKDVGQPVARGERIGMIKFGSRTELYIPLRLRPSVVVKPGDKVRGGADVIARLAPTADVLAARAELEPLVARETPA